MFMDPIIFARHILSNHFLIIILLVSPVLLSFRFDFYQFTVSIFAFTFLPNELLNKAGVS